VTAKWHHTSPQFEFGGSKTMRWQNVGPSNVDWCLGDFNFSFNSEKQTLFWWLGSAPLEQREAKTLRDALIASAKIVIEETAALIADVNDFIEEVHYAD
jgi:hypothetical protein